MLASSADVQETLREQINKGVYGDGTAPAAFDPTMLLHRMIWKAMRLYSVLWFNIPYVTNDVTIENYRFVKGSGVMILPS
ncbi:cytochrome P450 [Bradyrhizobium elkanii]